MIEQRWLLFLIGWGVAAALQGVLYLRQRKARGATLVDAGWAFSLALFAVLYLTWVAYALIALAAPYGWLALSAPALMLYLIAFVTGIPPAEEEALRSRGDDYLRYQRETSAFVPLPPRSAA
jgi:steroid 5-alpha reductase family enzyme